MARNMEAVAERVEQDAVREVKAEGRVYHSPEVHDLGTLAAVGSDWDGEMYDGGDPFYGDLLWL